MNNWTPLKKIITGIISEDEHLYLWLLVRSKHQIEQRFETSPIQPFPPFLGDMNVTLIHF